MAQDSAQDLRPALAASLALHLGLAAAGLIALRHPPATLKNAAVPITVVMRAPQPDVRPAAEAQQAQTAAAPEPEPEPEPAPPPPAAAVEPAPAPTPPAPPPPAPRPIPRPEPKPEPAPPKPAPPKPAPKPEPKPAPAPAPKPTPAPKLAPAPKPAPTPAPPRPQPPALDLDALATKAKPTPKLDLDALAAKAAKGKPSPRLDLNALAAQAPKPSAKPGLDLAALASKLPKAAARGPARAETDTTARPALGAAQGLTADERSLLTAKLIRLWNPNCGAEGASSLIVTVNIHLTPDGRLSANPTLENQSGDPVWQAAAQRALSAVARGEPYSELSRARYATWKDLKFNFNGKAACS